MKLDAELQRYRDLMKPPDTFEEGFGLKAMIGGLFVGLIMTPASMYMHLVVGGDIGSAAQWVTIILFVEVARRSFTVLRRPEIYVLYYMAGASLVSNSGLLWNQFLVQSESFRQFGLADAIPPWVSPLSPDVLGKRNFFMVEWLVPIGMLSLGMFLQRLDHFGLGYIMYRITSDVEKLPFPMAPVGAQGITALADASSGQETWRWRTFSFGAMLGMSFAIVYMALPAVSGALLPQSIQVFPIPFYDLTQNTETLLPAVPMILSFNLGFMISGMVLPFWAMVGSFIGLIITMVANPILYHTGVLHQWSEGVGAIATINANYLDFYLSFGLGLTAAVALIGFYTVFSGLFSKKKALDEAGAPQINWKNFFHPPAGRGDLPLWVPTAIYLFSTGTAILTAYLLLSWAHRQNPQMNSAVSMTLILVLCFYGFIYTPIISYVSARMEGIVGMTVAIPFVREATFILTGYQGAAIWFAPFPAHNYGAQTMYFRKTELTGTRISSMVKAEAFVFPVALLSTLLFSQFIWAIAPVPSSAFQFADKFWELQAFRQATFISSTMPGGQHGPFFEAFRPEYIFIGLGLALTAYITLAFFGAPILLVYGVVRGLDQSTPDVILPQFLGALLGRFYFRKKFGKQWPQYSIVFLAGYTCGTGLIMMFALGIVFMSKSVFQAAF